MRILSRHSLGIVLIDLLVWLIAMVIFVFLRFYHNYSEAVAVRLVQPTLEFQYTLWLGVQTGLILGLVYGIVDVFLDQHWLRKRSYRSVLIIKGLIHVVIIFCLSVLIRVEAFDKMDIEVTPEQLRSSLANPNVLIILAYTTLVNFMINFTRQITLKFGPGNLGRFLSGEFHRPKEEVRIFMFLDMKDSTTHAERLGHIRFGELVQDCFSDLTVIEHRRSEVYQYVGDEAIVYWEVEKGLRNLNCILAYFDFKQKLESRSAYYLSKYEVVPEFKAGMNLGQVTVTEIGDIKRDLAFLGDTMNTAARIQDLCNKLQQDLLISEFLYQQLPDAPGLKIEFVDNLGLRGKLQSVGVYAVSLQAATQP